MSATADQEMAELRRAYEEMRSERDSALAALARRNTEYGERIEYQAATIDVLKAMSASPGDPQPVFDLIAVRARDLCDAYGLTVLEFDGTLIHQRAATGVSDDPRIREESAARFPRPATRDSPAGRAILERQTIRIDDLEAEPDLHPVLRRQTAKSTVTVPLMRGNTAIGALSLGSRERGGFSDTQIQLLQTFAEQAVIAISSAETYRALHEALEQQTATAEVLQIINSSPGNLSPVFEGMLERAMRLCNAFFGLLYTYDGERFHTAAQRGVPIALAEFRAKNPPAELYGGQSPIARLISERRTLHIVDTLEDEFFQNAGAEGRSIVDLGGARTILCVPLVKDEALQGQFTLYRQEVLPFSNKQIALLENFAAQAVIAMENARLLNEQREALEQQTATAEVLQVINASPGDLVPVFDAMLERTLELCGAAFGTLYTFDGELFKPVAFRGVAPGFADLMTKYPPTRRPGSPAARTLETKRPVDVPDLMEEENYKSGLPAALGLVEVGGFRAFINVPLVKDGEVLGIFTIYRRHVGKFSDKQIALLENFAAQAVIAMENARLLSEIRQRQEELRITFENMGDGVAMFDDTQRLVAWNSKFQEVFDLPEDLLQQHRTYEDYLRFLAKRGDFGAGVDTAEEIGELVASTRQPYGYERTRPDGRVIEIRRNPVPDGGFVLIFSDITERKRSEAEIRAARDAAEAAYRDLKAAQASLIQAEKMASLGQLTAGIAHEIKNPLNFVNNFAELSGDMLDELNEAVANNRQAEVDELTETLKGNLTKIVEHGRRADGIVRGMLEHSRGSSGERREVELNVLVDEALNLAYHGGRAQDQSFSVTLQREFGEGIAPITLAPQDVTRVLLNLFSNGFYAARERQRTGATPSFEPTLKVSTCDLDGAVEIRVRDNGIGIPAEIKDRLFQPFFTTKPPGEGTGLGLSMSYDIITQQHGGSITVDSRVGEYSEFTVRLPRTP